MRKVWGKIRKIDHDLRKNVELLPIRDLRLATALATWILIGPYSHCEEKKLKQLNGTGRYLMIPLPFERISCQILVTVGYFILILYTEFIWKLHTFLTEILVECIFLWFVCVCGVCVLCFCVGVGCVCVCLFYSPPKMDFIWPF